MSSDFRDLLGQSFLGGGYAFQRPGQQPFIPSAEDEYHRAKNRHEAMRRLAAESYRGTQDIDWSDFLTSTEDAWLVPDLLSRNSMNLLVGKSTLGKTFLTVDLVACGALGQSWHGRSIHQFKTLVYLSEGVRGYVTRFRAWAQAHGADLEDIMPNVTIKRGANLTSEAFQQRLAEDVQELQADLVIFDTYSGTSGVADENDAANAARLLEETATSCDGAATLLVHHPNKASENKASVDLRGSGVLRNNVDTVVALYKDSNFQGPQGSSYVALSTFESHGGKVKDGTPVALRGFYIEGVDFSDQWGDGNSAVLRKDAGSLAQSEADDAILTHLTTEPMKAADLVTLIGKPASTVQRWLANSEFAEKVGEGRNTLWKLAAPVGFDEAEILEV